VIASWDGIEEFVAVCEAGSFTGAAATFGASVTHMSRSVARLETRLQVQLLHRTTRSLRLTETGQYFFERCQRLVEDRKETFAAILAESEPQGHLRITCSYALGERFVAPMVRHLMAERPALSVTIDLDNGVRDLIRDGFDLAIRTGHLPDSRLIARRIAFREVVTLASPAYLDTRGRPRTVAELAGHDCILGSASSWHFGGGKKFQPKGRWRCNSGASVLDAAIAGLGICQIPAFYLGTSVKNGLIEPILQDFAPEDEPIWAVYPQQRHLSPKVALVVDHLQENLQAALERRETRGPVTGG